MAYDDRLGDYIDVAARLVEFRAKHPDGSLQPVNLERPFWTEEIGGQLFVVYVAAAYRTPEDPRPGIGCAYEPFPGRTPYTKMSELQNAETAAWGRAIMAALAADSRKGIASREEVRNRQAEREMPPQAAPPPSKPMLDSQRKAIFAAFGRLGRTDPDTQREWLSWVAGRPLASRGDLTEDEARKAIAELNKRQATQQAPGQEVAA
jgi:hypothetical protein